MKSPGKGWRVLPRRPASPGDWLFQGAALLAGLSLVGVLAAMAASLLDTARPALTAFGLGFLFSSIWDPVREVFGALPAIYGTLLTSAIAIAVAVPVSLGVAIFLAELAPRWLRTPASFLVEMLAAIPSVVLGLWGIFVMAPAIYPAEQWLERVLGWIPLFRGPIFGGFGFLTGGLILAIMALPIITAIARDAILTVPPAQKEAMLALGATRWEAISGAILPYARSGVIAASILGLGRALGETMAVTFVIGNAHRISASLFAPGNTIASTLANEFSEATEPLYVSSLVALGLVLYLITYLLQVVSQMMLRRMYRAWSVGL